MIEAGQMAPAFTLDSSEGAGDARRVSLKELRGKVVVLFFYPTDDTPTCTREACGFREASLAFADAGVVLLGISPDDLESHHKFREKFSLPFPLLVDVDHKVAEKYGIWKEKLNYGRKYMGIERTTVVIGPQGKVMKVFNRVRVDGHAERVLEIVKASIEPAAQA